MTIFLPLEASSPLPQSPSFLVPSSESSAQVKKVVKAILKARRIAVVCGAGISVQAGIPDFRSSDGLFQSLKKDNPTLSSGRDLFDASVFNSEPTTSMFCQMIAQLSELSEVATPTSFHKLLRALDERRRLLRVYTQNIDALEQKSGLTFGVPELDCKRYKPRSARGRVDSTNEAGPSVVRVEPEQPRLPTPPMETPRCIPLHGTLQMMHCQTCTHSFPLRDYMLDLGEGRPPYCPECTSLEETRQLIGKRSRGVGKLRPSVVLYNEMHKDGEEVGDVVRRDLLGSSKGKGRAGADLLLVVGTSLRVPGTKRIVREFSKAVHSRSTPPVSQNELSTTMLGLTTPTHSPRRSPAGDDEPPIKTVYLNLDFPVPTREWEGVFDVWIRGDAQEFARLVHEEMDREEQAKQAAIERKRQREEAILAAQLEGETEVGKIKGKKRKDAPGSEVPPSAIHAKRRKVVVPITPVSASKHVPTKRLKIKKPDSKVLPTLTKGKSRDNNKTRLIIRIPPRPEVLITTPAPKPTKKKHLTTPNLTPPDSPLSFPSSSLPRQRKSSTGSGDWSTSSHSPPSHGPGWDAKLAARARRQLSWDNLDALSDLSDNEPLDECAESYLPTVPYAAHRPGS
ncbi:uncharacterized protein FIBRA_02101 [Fibroporia radiculosa]|uniref:Deacetylase sirtuin-type domain-containing protein n=1 Tax=Fibroporia radiculosa TaxID=599839 RepID=J4H1N3_9APHY|nr:uncharacterized protein FIBRA_02101 [Fibroporia radiculosa]CCM00074.1 predicted protein [Fibroporia radiculosa]